MKKILALVDDLLFASRIEGIVRADGYDVCITPITTGAATVAREWEPDGIVVSFGAPFQEWEDAIRAIRAEPSLVKTPLLAFGPHVDTAGRAAATAAGATRVVTNGAFFSRMSEAIAALIGEGLRTEKRLAHSVLGPSQEVWMQFVDSAWLAAHLADGSAIAVDTRTPQEYAQGHIAGAVSAYPYGAQAVSTPAGDAQFRAYVVEYMTNLGITGDETLVFYAMKNETTDARGLWTADFAGYEKSALLAGGLQQWLAESRPVSQAQDNARQRPAQRAPAFTPHWNEATFATADEAAAASTNPAVVLLDVRSEGEHTGSAQGRYAGVNPRLGRIPGSVWIEWTELSNADGTYKSPDEIRQLLAAKGVTPDKEVITYCQGGGRAAHSYAALKSAGFGDVRHYVGSFGDYSHRTDLPIDKDAD